MPSIAFLTQGITSITVSIEFFFLKQKTKTRETIEHGDPLQGLPEETKDNHRQ